MSEPWDWTKQRPLERANKIPAKLPRGTKTYIIEIMRAAPTWVGFYEIIDKRTPDNMREVFKAEMALHWPTRESAEEAAFLYAATRKDPVIGHVRVVTFVWD